MQHKKTDEYIALYKIVLLGDVRTGKTNLMHRVTRNEFTESYTSSIGTDWSGYTMNQIKLQVWDPSGQDRFWSLNSSMLRGAQCVIIVYDVTNYDSFLNIPKWVEKASSISNNVPIFLVGTKTDLICDRKITSEEGEEFAKSGKIPNCIGWAEVSSKENFNVDHVFHQMVSIIGKADVEAHQANKIQESNQKSLERYNQLTENQKKYVSQLQFVWAETSKKLTNNVSETNIQLALIKSVLDFYTKNNNPVGLLFSPNSWSSHHIPDVKLISNSIITSNSDPEEIIERLERLNPVATGDVASIIYFLKEKFQYCSANEEKKMVSRVSMH